MHDRTKELDSSDIGNGFNLYWKENSVGGRIYYSDEVGGGVFVWDTSLIDEHTLLAVILKEKELQKKEFYEKNREDKK